MFKLTITQGGETKTVPFEGPAKLSELLRQAGVWTPHPCGGRGSCGKCAVTVTGAVSPPNAAETRAGTRLSCQIVLLGDAAVTLPDAQNDARIETESIETIQALHPMEGLYGAAVDIGTTTLAAKLFDLQTGECLGTSSRLNPQTSAAADVMGRIGAAMNGGLESLQAQVTEAIADMLRETGGPAPDALVLTGNTTMLYLLTGRNPEPLSHAPFEADTLFGTEREVLGKRAYLPPCMNAFVGADITCAVLASGMCGKEETAMLCDIGTNGEIALWHNRTLYVTSTAAGPAFEGAGISCGCGSVPGAVDQVTVEDGQLCVHTIDGGKAVGVCGSGLIDAVAAGLEMEEIDETGLLENGELSLSDGVALQQKDIRAVQLAKAAIAAGISVLLDTAGVSADDVKRFYIAGGFGSHLNVPSAVRIGLLPESFSEQVQVLGNAALSGAAMALLDRSQREKLEEIAARSKHVNLGGSPRFNEAYVDEMFFE